MADIFKPKIIQVNKHKMSARKIGSSSEAKL